MRKITRKRMKSRKMRRRRWWWMRMRRRMKIIAKNLGRLARERW